MKYPAKIYSKSLAEALVGKKKEEQEKILSNFISLVKKNKDEVKLKKILEEAQSFYLKKTGKDKIIFEFAREGTHFKDLESIAKEGDIIEKKTNPDLIAGVKVVINGEKQFDYSLANKLKNI